jgi:putative cell wall-binding protein
VSVRRKNVAGSVVAALVALSLAAMTSMATSAAAAASIVRFQGADRFATSAAITQASYAPGVPVAYIATGLNFPDALAGGAAAAKAGGPLLLVRPDLIPTQIAAELTRLTPASIIVLGGTGAVSDAVLTTLQTYTSGSVTRVSGADRYTTAASLAASFPTGSPVFIATGKDFPDALAGTAAAAAQHAAILLTTPTTIPAGTAAALSALAPSSITILGGTGVVSAAVATQLGAYTPTVTRLSGSDRYATAAAIATSAFPSATGVFITTGAGFADALTGGPVAGTAGQPLLLATQTCLPTATAAVVAADAPTTVTLLGGTGVLGPGVESLTTCAPPAAANTARSILLKLTVGAERGSTTYLRTNFKLWIDANGDCQNTRAEVLIAESKVTPTFTTTSHCTVATGKWYSYYDGATWTLASDVDIDHMVPLKEAWESGARLWSVNNRTLYANDLGFAASLVAVTDNVNSSKGDSDPAAWLPPLTTAQCTYATQWVQVKYRWRLSIDSAEYSALSSILSGSCGARAATVPARAI